MHQTWDHKISSSIFTCSCPSFWAWYITKIVIHLVLSVFFSNYREKFVSGVSHFIQLSSHFGSIEIEWKIISIQIDFFTYCYCHIQNNFAELLHDCLTIWQICLIFLVIRYLFSPFLMRLKNIYGIFPVFLKKKNSTPILPIPICPYLPG